MIQDNKYLMHYTAEEGMVIVPKKREDNSMWTKEIWVGSVDSIDNYEEIPESEIQQEEENVTQQQAWSDEINELEEQL